MSSKSKFKFGDVVHTLYKGDNTYLKILGCAKYHTDSLDHDGYVVEGINVQLDLINGNIIPIYHVEAHFALANDKFQLLYGDK